MITVYLNAEPKDIHQTISLTEALKQWGYSHNYFAIAINRTFIPNTHYSTTFLQEGDTIDVVAPMQGG